jgi:putative PIN family toxin of toxin-antitoxin system
LRIVLDATVLVRAHPRSHSVGRKVLNAVLEGRHTLLLSNEIIVETTRVLRYPRLRKLHALTEDELYDYAQFLQEVCQTVVLDHPYHAPLRDPNDLDVMQTAERGDADVLCSNDGDFHDAAIITFCRSRGIDVCHEVTLLARLVGPAREV